jgi:hypothetical protein
VILGEIACLRHYSSTLVSAQEKGTVQLAINTTRLSGPPPKIAVVNPSNEAAIETLHHNLKYASHSGVATGGDQKAESQ